MKLISCRIENFGVLSGLERGFEDGLNEIHSENGRGKSTLAAFIRVMLFGFEGERSRGEIDNERRRYAPWQGGAYGGRLEFEAGGRRYILNRSFGRKESEDSFELLDAETLLPSEDFGRNVGEDLFGLDAASFKRTTFLSQQDCETAATDGVSAKIGGLSALSDDMASFTRADSALNDAINATSPKRKTGSAYRLRASVDELEREASRSAAVEDELLALEAEEGRLRAVRAELLERQSELFERQRELNRIKLLLEKKREYEGLRRRAADRRAELAAAEAAFPGPVPNRDELRRRVDESVALTGLEAKAESLSLSDAESEWLTSLAAVFEGGEAEVERAIDEKTALLGERDEILRSAEQKTAEYEAAEASLRKWRAALIILLVVAAAGGAVCAAGLAAVGACIAAAGLVGAVAFGLCLCRAAKRAAGSLAEVNAQRERAESLEADAAEYLRAFGVAAERPEGGLYLLKTRLADYRALSAKSEKLRLAVSEAQSARADLEGYLASLLAEPGESPHARLLRLSELLTARDAREAALKAAEAEMLAFEERESLAEILAADESRDGDAAAVNAELEGIAARLEGQNDELARVGGRLREKRDERERVYLAARRLGEERERLAAETERHRVCEKTRELLARARASLVSRYTGPVAEGFRRYQELLEAGGADFELDASLALKADVGNKLRDTGFLSVGWRDLAGICLRMAIS